MSHNYDNGCRLEPSSTSTSTEVETTNEQSKVKKKDGSKYVPNEEEKENLNKSSPIPISRLQYVTVYK